jgi:cytochrome c oxidase cbb3-type subunit 3
MPTTRPDEPYNDQLTGHNYDGIQEYDNPTPGWWVWIFIATVVFGLGYFFVVTAFRINGTNAAGEEVTLSYFGKNLAYERAETAALMRQFAELGELSQDQATLARFVNDPEEAKWLAAGQSIYQANCAACHGSGGVGLSGPNLTDDHYLNLTEATGILRVVNKGANNGAMPAWEAKLQSNEVVLVSAYVASLRGQHRPGRAPEGQVIEPFFADD